FRAGHAVIDLADGLRHRHAEGLGLDDRPELALHGLGGLVGDDADAIAERETGLDTADDHVERVGDLVGEGGKALLAAPPEIETRQPEASDEKSPQRNERIAA